LTARHRCTIVQRPLSVWGLHNVFAEKRAKNTQRCLGARFRLSVLDALLTAVQEMGQIADVKTPYIDAVLALVQQRGKVAGVYPVFPMMASAPQAAAHSPV